MSGVTAAQPGTIGYIYDLDTMTVEQAMKTVNMYIMDIQSKAVDALIDEMKVNADKLEALTELQGLLADLEKALGDTKTGKINGKDSNAKAYGHLEPKINAAIRKCEEAGLDMSDAFNSVGKVELRPYEFNPPTPPMPLELRNYLEELAARNSCPEARELLAINDHLVAYGHTKGLSVDGRKESHIDDMMNERNLYGRISDGGDYSEKNVRNIINRIPGGKEYMDSIQMNQRNANASYNRYNDNHEVYKTAGVMNLAFNAAKGIPSQKNEKFTGNVESMDNAVSMNMNVSDFLAGVSRVQGKTKLLDQDVQKNMTIFNKENGLMNFSTDLIIGNMKSVADANKEILQKT